MCKNKTDYYLCGLCIAMCANCELQSVNNLIKLIKITSKGNWVASDNCFKQCKGNKWR